MQSMRPALWLAAVLTLVLAVMQLMPRPGDGLAVVFPPGMAPEAALAAVLHARPGWRLLGLSQGPLAVVYAEPAVGESASLPPGALILLSAPLRQGCDPLRPVGVRT